jgi:carbamoyl-phosphate synthase large subunit
VVDRPHVVPRLTDGGYLPMLLDICRAEAVDLVFPLIDPDVPVLAQHRDVIAAVGTSVVVVDAAAAAIAEDKWQTYKWFQSIGIPTPPTWLPAQVHPTHVPYPVFVKPRRGSASVQCFKAHNPRDLWFLSDHVTRPIVQEWLPGPEVTSDVTCDLTGRCIGVVSRQRLETRSGEVTKGVTIYDADIVEHCRRIAQELRAVGPITVQGMWGHDRFLFTEINARFGGGLPLGIAAGGDSPRWLLAQAAGLEVDIPPLGNYRTGMYLTRFDDSFIFPEIMEPTAASHHL